MSPKNNDAPLIELKHVGKTYTSGRLEYHALRDINLTIHAGELAAIIGPSGSGKSTLMHLIGLLDSTTEGTYRLNVPLSEMVKSDLCFKNFFYYLV